MNIEFPKKSAYSFEHASIAFPAIVDGTHHRVLATQEALQDHFGASYTADADELLSVFERHRGQIERVARAMLEQMGPGDVILKTALF